ncbi:uncharacterized protein FOMMEDRAFT_157068 [Fomitiporia mediterranea MF3/22]|uniref:uncharacterized protein n=1 Tax=Fomitiporia mediterranea (strain MF3/22) TaxID=694068 RepID=UPI00044084B7|nr:uncharacterized protein FOMMEDRAFT_157068 [Fomitiporia mediterranea MF3/22]EJD01927.1 hypothetical protein FOMMEDRAFT_157068 [Fomitiporia mediterranea MF3/22]
MGKLAISGLGGVNILSTVFVTAPPLFLLPLAPRFSHRLLRLLPQPIQFAAVYALIFLNPLFAQMAVNSTWFPTTRFIASCQRPVEQPPTAHRNVSHRREPSPTGSTPLKISASGNTTAYHQPAATVK